MLLSRSRKRKRWNRSGMKGLHSGKWLKMKLKFLSLISFSTNMSSAGTILQLKLLAFVVHGDTCYQGQAKATDGCFSSCLRENYLLVLTRIKPQSRISFKKNSTVLKWWHGTFDSLLEDPWNHYHASKMKQHQDWLFLFTLFIGTYLSIRQI